MDPQNPIPLTSHQPHKNAIRCMSLISSLLTEGELEVQRLHRWCVIGLGLNACPSEATLGSF